MKPKHYILVMVIIFIGSAVAAFAVQKSRTEHEELGLNEQQQTLSLLQTEDRTKFPDIDQTKLTPTQQKVVTILKQEFEAQPDGTKYSQGTSEPWCADFVSWVYNQAGKPLTNPNSKSWRIPGTITLRDYYQSKGKFKAASSKYSPKVGDIMLYQNPSPFGNHTNMVIKNDNGVVTTVGGNEYGKIHVIEHVTKDSDGFIGYGVF